MRLSMLALAGLLLASTVSHAETRVAVAVGNDTTVGASRSEGERVWSTAQARPPQGPSSAGKLLGVSDVGSMLPADVPVDPEVLRTVQTHPFFANAPPIRITTFRVRTQSTDHAGVVIQEGEINTRIRGLNGALRLVQTVATFSSLGTIRSVIRIEALFGGVVSVSDSTTYESHTANQPVAKFENISATTKVDQLEGTVFPMAVGKRYGHRSISRGIPDLAGDFESIARCEVERKLQAAEFHQDLKGDAFVIKCNYRSSRSGTQKSNSNTQVFFPELGAYISNIDAIDPRVFRRERNGHSRLESFTVKD